MIEEYADLPSFLMSRDVTAKGLTGLADFSDFRVFRANQREVIRSIKAKTSAFLKADERIIPLSEI